MRQEIKQSTTSGQVTINRADGTTVHFSNGGVDGEFEVIITDQETIPALFEKVGEFAGDYSIKGLKLGAATPVINLAGKYVVYGNAADGNVMLVKQSK
ncbi:MAG: hypothetical protein ACI4UB_05615 [Limosilactobacillus sp.]